MLTGFPEGLLLSFNVKPRVLTAFTSEVVESFVFAFVGLVYVLWVLCPGFLWLRFGLGFYAFAVPGGATPAEWQPATGVRVRVRCFMRVLPVLCVLWPVLCVLWRFIRVL